MHTRFLVSIAVILLVGGLAVVALTHLNHYAATAQANPETAIQNDAANAQASKMIEQLVATDNANSRAMLESLYTSRMDGEEIEEECAQQVQKRADRIGQLSVLDVPSTQRDTYLKLLEAENRLVRAMKAFEDGRRGLFSAEDILGSLMRLQNYQLVPKWEATVEDRKQQTKVDRTALLAQLSEVVSFEQRFKAVAPTALRYEAIYSQWQEKIKDAGGGL